MARKNKEESCMDKHCPQHNGFSTRGAYVKGKITKIYGKTGTIELYRNTYVKKYERHLLKRSRIKVHIPECMQLKEGDEVMARETRPISKTKHFVVVKDESN